MIFISPADFSINFLKPIYLENKLYYVKLYVYNKHISTLLDKVIKILLKRLLTAECTFRFRKYQRKPF